MNKQNILSKVDHTLLAQGATWQDIKSICDDAVKYNAASVCIPPAYVKPAKEYVGGKIKICTVIGFPNGYNTTEVKCFETADAVKNGADEIDMVINIGMLKDKRYDDILYEINEIKKACELCVEAKADYVKTSTGFSTRGATIEDVQIMKAAVQGKAKVKAAGGVRTHEDMVKIVEAGADRIGTSAGCSLVEK